MPSYDTEREARYRELRSRLEIPFRGCQSPTAALASVELLDSHTVGEPTRVVVRGGPDLRAGSASERRLRFQAEHDAFRARLVNEPRGLAATVGVVLGPPTIPGATLQAVYFNNVGYLTMCVHATIGLVHTLATYADLPPGTIGIETPAGLVRATLGSDGSVSVENVPSARTQADVVIETERHGLVTGHVAWGGNQFFVTPDPLDDIRPAMFPRLDELAWDIRRSLARAGIVGHDGEEVDHVYLTGSASRPELDQRNFVLCPGGAYDRSPCGTGTSANLACLAAEERLAPGEVWHQESCIGTAFEASYRLDESGAVVPTVTGRAYMVAETRLLLEASDPFPEGVPE